MIKNTKSNYGLVAVSLHWLMTILIIGMLTVGLYMVSLPKGPDKFFFIGWHKQIGVIVLALALLRLYWRIINTRPELLLPSWEKYSALFVHWAFYALMISMPLSGWLMSSASGHVVSFFGFSLPALINPNENLSSFFGDAHEYMAYLLIALIVVHTLAALKHQFFDRDDILKRML